jgi:DNA repair protein RecO (recombination protein O)
VFFKLKPGSTLAFLERCELEHSGFEMAVPARFAYGSYLLELVDLLTHEGERISEVFDLFLDALTHLETGPATSGLLRGFEIHLLHVLGYSPALQRCPRCGEDLAQEAPTFFDASQGQVLCQSCGPTAAQTRKFAAATVAALVQLQALSLDDSRSVRLPPATAREAAQLMGHLLAVHLPRPLRSLELIAALGR